MARNQRDGNDLTASGQHDIAACDVLLGHRVCDVRRIVPALHEDVRLKPLNQSKWRVLGETEGEIDASQMPEQRASILELVDGSLWPLVQTANTFIVIDPDNQDVSEGPGGSEIGRMSEVQYIKNAVGENDALTRFFEGVDLVPNLLFTHHPVVLTLVLRGLGGPGAPGTT